MSWHVNSIKPADVMHVSLRGQSARMLPLNSTLCAEFMDKLRKDKVWECQVWRSKTKVRVHHGGCGWGEKQWMKKKKKRRLNETILDYFLLPSFLAPNSISSQILVKYLPGWCSLFTVSCLQYIGTAYIVAKVYRTSAKLELFKKNGGGKKGSLRRLFLGVYQGSNSLGMFFFFSLRNTSPPL